MKKACRFRRTRVTAAVGSVALSFVAGHAGLAHGSAFALQEQSGSGLGNAFAGGAASADDASTIFTNPAGMSRMPGIQAVIAGSLICPSAKFRDNGSQPAMFQPLGGDGGDAGECSGLPVPAAYLVVPINSQWAMGLGLNAPFGLKTEYDSGWIGRFQAVESKVETVNLNPSVSYKVNDMVSLGGGFSYQHIRATLTKQVNYAGAIAQAAAQAAGAGQIPAGAVAPIVGAYAGAESNADVSGNDSGWGWNIGVLVNIDPQTRFGASYRSKIKYDVAGSANITNPPVPTSLPPTLAPIAAVLANAVNNVLASGDISLALKLPDTGNVSIFRQIDSKWDVMGDVQYTGWHSIQSLTVVRSTGAVLDSTPENFRNTWRGSVGANYHYNDQWLFRGGLAYDESPIRSATLTPRLPDNGRTWLSFGVQYKVTPQLVLDAGYTYIIVKDPQINQNEGSTAANGLISGSYKNNVNVLAGQVTYTFK